MSTKSLQYPITYLTQCSEPDKCWAHGRELNHCVVYVANANPMLAGSALTKEPSDRARLWAYGKWHLSIIDHLGRSGVSLNTLLLFAYLVFSKYQATFCFLGDHRTKDTRARLPQLRNGLLQHHFPFPSLSGQLTDKAISEVLRRSWFKRACPITSPWVLIS